MIENKFLTKDDINSIKDYLDSIRLNILTHGINLEHSFFPNTGHIGSFLSAQI